jgi:hypothetical protein
MQTEQVKVIKEIQASETVTLNPQNIFNETVTFSLLFLFFSLHYSVKECFEEKETREKKLCMDI